MFITWLHVALWVGQVNRILCFDWLPKWRFLTSSELPAVSCKKIVLFFLKIIPLQTKLVWSRWLDIGLALFLRVYGHQVHLDPWTDEKELGQTPAILAPHLVYISYCIPNETFIYLQSSETLIWYQHRILKLICLGWTRFQTFILGYAFPETFEKLVVVWKIQYVCLYAELESSQTGYEGNTVKVNNNLTDVLAHTLTDMLVNSWLFNLTNI